MHESNSIPSIAARHRTWLDEKQQFIHSGLSNLSDTDPTESPHKYSQYIDLIDKYLYFRV